MKLCVRVCHCLFTNMIAIRQSTHYEVTECPYRAHYSLHALCMRFEIQGPAYTVLLIALAFENCVDLAHAPLAFLYSDFVWGLCGSKVTRKTQPFKRKCNQQYTASSAQQSLSEKKCRYHNNHRFCYQHSRRDCEAPATDFFS